VPPEGVSWRVVVAAKGAAGRRVRRDAEALGDHRQQHGEPSPPAPSAQRLRPGQHDGLVLEYIDSQGQDVAVGATAMAKALGRSAGAACR
jgi:hypothetical protein